MARAALVAVLLLGAGVALAGQPPGTLELGARIGLVTNTNNELAAPDAELQVFVNSRNVFAEGFGAFYLARPLAVVMNLGSYSKGDIRFVGYDPYYGSRTFFGSATIYPVQLGLRLDPFERQLPGGLSPYFEGGGALIIGRETVTQAYYDIFQNAFVDGVLQTETDWDWWSAVGAGLPLSEKIRLDFMVKYMHAQFSGDIAGLTDYSGWQVTIGVGYRAVSK